MKKTILCACLAILSLEYGIGAERRFFDTNTEVNPDNARQFDIPTIKENGREIIESPLATADNATQSDNSIPDSHEILSRSLKIFV